jgi:trk system potassium uptake protein TrkA
MNAGDKRFVVVGGGRVGLRTAVLLRDRAHRVVVVEQDERRCEEIVDEYVATVIEGDATRPGVLKQADLDRTDAVLAMTGHTGTNLAVCLAVDRLASHVQTVMRADRPRVEEYADLVDTVIFPERAGARVAANAVEPQVRALEEVTGEIDVAEVTVAEDAPVAGRTLADVSLPRGCLVVSDADGDSVSTRDTKLVPGRTYVVAIEPGVSDEVRRLFRG